MIVVDKLCYLSKLRYVNPFEKFTFAMLALIFCIVSRSILMGIAVMALNSYLTVRVGGISAGRYLKLMSIPLTFLLLSTVAIIFNFSKTPLDAFGVHMGNFYLTCSYASLWYALQLTVTAMAAVSCLYFLSLNTTMTDILWVLRKLKMPLLVCELMLLIYRYIFVLLDIAYYITTAQNARLGHKDLKTSINSFSGMVQALFIRAMKKSRYLYDAMEARCYDGVINVLDECRPVSMRNMILIGIFQLVLLAVTIYIKLK